MTAQARLATPAAKPAFLMPILLLLATCAREPQTAEGRANQATIAACRQRADEVYVRQNREQLYQSSNSVTPFSAGPTSGLPTHGLSALYAHDQFIDDCVRNTGTQTQRNGGPGEPPPGEAAPAPAEQGTVQPLQGSAQPVLGASQPVQGAAQPVQGASQTALPPPASLLKPAP